MNCSTSRKIRYFLQKNCKLQQILNEIGFHPVDISHHHKKIKTTGLGGGESSLAFKLKFFGYNRHSR